MNFPKWTPLESGGGGTDHAGEWDSLQGWWEQGPWKGMGCSCAPSDQGPGWGCESPLKSQAQVAQEAVGDTNSAGLGVHLESPSLSAQLILAESLFPKPPCLLL